MPSNSALAIRALCVVEHFNLNCDSLKEPTIKQISSKSVSAGPATDHRMLISADSVKAGTPGACFVFHGKTGHNKYTYFKVFDLHIGFSYVCLSLII